MAENYDRSPDRGGSFGKAMERSRQLSETIRRAFVEFLKVPTIVIIGFLLLALVMFVIDESRAAYGPSSEAAWGGLFSDPQASRDFLGLIAVSTAE